MKLVCQSKIINPEVLETFADELRAQGKILVTLNGSFDLLHAGHLYILEEAAKLGDCLLVLLNTDESIRGYKGNNRPIIDLENRQKMLAALECVDFVSAFEELSPIEVLRKIKPSIHANGAEYGLDCIEAEVVREGGGKVCLIDRIPGLSTSEIIEKIKTL